MILVSYVSLCTPQPQGLHFPCLFLTFFITDSKENSTIIDMSKFLRSYRVRPICVSEVLFGISLMTLILYSSLKF